MVSMRVIHLVPQSEMKMESLMQLMLDKKMVEPRADMKALM